jgi:FkbM family methyltransferase
LLELPWVRRLFFDSVDQELLVQKTKEGSVFVVSTHDAIIGRGTFGNQISWDYDLLVKALELLPSDRKPKTLIDIGANVGSIGVSAAKQGLFTRVLLIEPDPLNFRLLRANTILSQVEDQVEIINVALGDGSSESLDFELSGDNFGDHRVRAREHSDDHHRDQKERESLERFDESKRQVISVPASTLDSVLTELSRRGAWPENSEALLFMDTQGYEGHILKGASSFLSRSTGAIVTEFWPYGLERAGDGFWLFERAILDSGFREFIDLNGPKETIELTPANLERLRLEYSEGGRNTDLLIF